MPSVSKKPVLLTGDSFLLMWKQSGDWLNVRAIFGRFFAFLLKIWPETQNFGLFLRFFVSVSSVTYCCIVVTAKIICKVRGSPLRNTRHPRQCKRGNRLRWGRTKWDGSGGELPAPRTNRAAGTAGVWQRGEVSSEWKCRLIKNMRDFPVVRQTVWNEGGSYFWIWKNKVKFVNYDSADAEGVCLVRYFLRTK